jgi:plastocyanin
MATYTWIGAAGGLYATTTNWSPTGLPAAADDIVFTGTATPNVSTTARTVRNLTVNSGTVTFSGTGIFTIQGDINNSGTLNMTTMTVNFTGGNSQTLNLGTNSFAGCTINKTNGTNLTLGAAWNVTGTATATLTVTNGNLYTQGYTVTCRVFTASGNTDRTIDLANGAIYVTGSSGTLWNTSHTTAVGTAWTKFARSGAAYIQPSSGTATIVVTGGGIASNYTAGATFNGVPPTFQLGNNRNYTVTGQFEDLEVNGNFAGTSTPQIWGSLTGTPVSYNNVTTTNPVIIGRTGVTQTVNWLAQVTSYTTQNPLSGTPTFYFVYARAVTFTLSSNTSTYYLWIDGNDTTGAAWQTAAFTVVCSGNNSSYYENIIRSTSTLTYTANGTGSTYLHTNFYDNSTTSAYTFGGNASTVHLIVSSFDTLGTVNFNFGELTLYDTSMYCRVFTSATGTGASGNQRLFQFNGYWIYINGNHRAGINGTGTLSIATLNNTVCTSDSYINEGGFWLQTTGTCTTGSWQGTYAIRFRVQALNNTTLNASITGCNLRSLEFYGPVNFTAAQTVNLINSNSSITWDEQGAAFNLTNLTATIASSTGGTFTILQNASSLANANYRLGVLNTLDASLNDDQTFNLYAYVRTLSLTKNTGIFNLNVNYAQTVTCSGDAGTTYNYQSVTTANPFTATWTPITGTSVAAPITKFQVPVKSTSGSGTGATFNIAKTGTGTAYSGITVAALGSGYAVGDTITLSGANLDGVDGTNDLTFTITAATQVTASGQSAGSTPVGISGTAVNTAQTRTNVPVKSSTGGGNDALFSVTKTGTGVVYFGVTTAVLTSGTAPADGSTIVISGANLGGVDGTNDLTFTFKATGTQHNLSGFQCRNTLDFVAGTLLFNDPTNYIIGNFTSTYTNPRAINFNQCIIPLVRTVTIGSTSQNLTIENPGGFDIQGTGTINTSGLSATADNNFDVHWRGSKTFTTGSAIRNLYIYTGAGLSTTSAITVNIRGVVSVGDGDGSGTGPFTGLTISFPAVANPGALIQQFNIETPTVIPSVTVLGTCTINSIRTTTLTLNPGPDYTATLSSGGHITTLVTTGTGGTIDLNNLDGLQTRPASLTFSGNAIYNLTGYFTSTTGGISCAGTSDNCVYNLNGVGLAGTGTANRLLFDGRGTLNVNSNLTVDRFDITNATVPRTLNFNYNQIFFGYPASISCNLATTTVIGQTNDSGGIVIGGAGDFISTENVTVTINGQTESNALNLIAYNVPVTLAGTLVYRTLQPYYGIKNTTGTLTVYGNYQLGTYYTPFSGVTINFAGNNPDQTQVIYTALLGPNTATMSGASPKLLEPQIWIKTLTTQNTTVIVPYQLYCDQIIVQGTTFNVDGTIYTNYWNNTDPSTYYWQGSGYLRLLNTETLNPLFFGNTTWTSIERFNSTSSRGAGTGPNLLLENTVQLDASTTQNPHRVRFLRRTNNPGAGQSNPIKVSHFFEEAGINNQQYGLQLLNLIFDPGASSQNNFIISSSYDMNTTSNPITIQNISSSNSTITIYPTSRYLYLNKIQFDDTANTRLITNSKNLTVGKIICGNAEFGNSIVTLNGGNDTIFDTGVVARNNAQSEIVTTGPGNKNFVVRDNNLNIVTNDSAFSHTGSGDGIGWLNLVHTEPRTIGTVRTSSGNFSKAIASSAVSKSTISANTVYPSRTTVSEGDTITWYVITNNMADGTRLYWTDSGNTSSSDWVGGATSGSFDVVNNTAIITRTVSLDLNSESTETSILNIRTVSTSGTIIATSNTVNILNKTITVLVTPSSTTVNEGNTITWTVTTTNISNGTTLYWTDSGNTSSSDWVGGNTSGSFVVSNNTATITRTVALDAASESTETSILNIRTGSISGTIIATSNTVNILNA